MRKFVITGQIRTRSELRQGQGTPPETSTLPAFLTPIKTSFTNKNIGQ
jgi:hypothetical protein